MSLKTSRMNLMARLTLHLGSEVALQAEGFASEPGMLQKVGKRFVRVNGQYFIPHSLQEIVLLGGSRIGRTVTVHMRTLYMGGFKADLARTGTDFAEVLVSRQEEEEELRILIPLRQLISIEITH